MNAQLSRGAELLEEALACPRCVLSVMGGHAGEGETTIFRRKQNDIERVGKTFWLIRSFQARPSQVQALCGMPTYAIFIAPATKGGARPTIEDGAATEFSADRAVWQRFPQGLGPVTGNLDASAAALVFDMMTTVVTGAVDLWKYREASETHNPLKFKLGCSTVCAVRDDAENRGAGMRSRYREVVSVARLAKPYCVWVR